jgi:phosphoribosyl-ATP pyrophosphohydrolase
MKDQSDLEDIKFNDDGLIPAIIQDQDTRQVLMLGYMNPASIEQTRETGLVTFYSRSKQRLWTKGERSKNHLRFCSWALDCDKDTLLIQALPQGPTCHIGTDTCWGKDNKPGTLNFMSSLEDIIKARHSDRAEGSYTASLFDKGTAKIAQKVGEEAVELVIEAMKDDDALFKGEAADLLYHFLVLLTDRGMSLSDIVDLLVERHQ